MLIAADPRNIELINEYKITEIIENKDKNNQSKFTLTCVNKKKPSNTQTRTSPMNVLQVVFK